MPIAVQCTGTIEVQHGTFKLKSLKEKCYFKLHYIDDILIQHFYLYTFTATPMIHVR